MKKSFLLYSDLEVLVSSLSDMNAGLLFKSILHYATTGNVLDLEDGATNMLYSVIRQRMDAATLNYNEVCRKRSEAGKKGGAKAGNTNAIKTSKCYQNKLIMIMIMSYLKITIKKIVKRKLHFLLPTDNKNFIIH